MTKIWPPMEFKTCCSLRQCFRIACNFKDVINVERNKVSYNNARIIMIVVCDCRIYTLRLPENREMDVNKCPTSSPQLNHRNARFCAFYSNYAQQRRPAILYSLNFNGKPKR
jgi:hypothetical protein